MAEEEKTEIQEKAPPNLQEKPAPQGQPAPAKEEKEKEGGKPQNCTKCKKRLSRKQWYYRDGNYFCSKGCWKSSKQTEAA